MKIAQDLKKAFDMKRGAACSLQSTSRDAQSFPHDFSEPQSCTEHQIKNKRPILAPFGMPPKSI
jgi:hypothetical protein